MSPLSFLLAAFGLTLSRSTGARALLAEVHPSDPAPVRIAIDDDLTPQAFLRGVHASLPQSLGHPIVQAVFTKDGETGPGTIETEIAAIRIKDIDSQGTELGISIQLNHCSPALTDWWSQDEAERFAMNYVAATEELGQAPAAGMTDTVLADIRCISGAGRATLDRINDTGRTFPPSSIDELFRAAAERWPSTIAVRDTESALTYAELAAAAAEQARLLRAAGVREGQTVLVGVPRSVAEVVAVLGVLWAGAAYIGIDLSQPDSHTARIISRSSPAAAIVADEDAQHVRRDGIPVVSPWRPGKHVDGGAALPARPDPDRLAYVAFTSGSTGEPKGVAVPHRAVIRLVHDAEYLALSSDQRVLRVSPLAFDASTVELWGCLVAGATLEVCPPDLMSASEIGSFIEKRRITFAWLTAGLFRLVEEFAAESLGSLRHLMTGGDVVSPEHVRRALEKNPGLMISNGYGPTENTVFTAVHPVRAPADINGPIPIGSPVPGTRVYVLDERGRLLMPGAVGELYTGGEGLAIGYLNDEGETARSFGHFSRDVPERLYRTGDLVRIDAANRLIFLGRVDGQVKVRGYRIELDAISQALSALQGVDEAVVTFVEGVAADKRLIAAIRLTPGAAITPADLSERLRSELPSYMVPTLWAAVDALPLTVNGKIDRRRIAAIARPAGWFAR